MRDIALGMAQRNLIGLRRSSHAPRYPALYLRPKSIGLRCQILFLGDIDPDTVQFGMLLGNHSPQPPHGRLGNARHPILRRGGLGILCHQPQAWRVCPFLEQCLRQRQNAAAALSGGNFQIVGLAERRGIQAPEMNDAMQCRQRCQKLTIFLIGCGV